MSKESELFPSIGAVAEQTEALSNSTESRDQSSTRDASEQLVQEIESLCMRCEGQGTTRLLLTSIPYFREVVVMSFRCEHCGFSNNEIQAAGSIRPEGAVYTAHILSPEDLNRQLVRSSSCAILLPEYELTLPASSRGQLTTVEGLLRDIVQDLEGDQVLRRIQDPDGHAKVQVLIDRLRLVVPDQDAEEEQTGPIVPLSRKADRSFPPFTVKLDDPAGNSFLEFLGSMSDPKWNMRTYRRTLEQNIQLGLVAAEESGDAAPTPTQVIQPAEVELSSVPHSGGAEGDNEEIYIFPGVCSSCGHPLNTLMKKVVIPYFKDILIMSTNCDRCGYRDNEVKSGAAISEHGKKITLKVEDREDLSRDILKSETGGLSIPEIDLELHAGTLGGRFTTVEGILDQVYEELSEKVFADDDAAGSDTTGRQVFETFLQKLKQVKNAEHPFTLILDDPLANSYIQNLYAPDPDPNMETISYDRTWQQNEDLGLNDMQVEGYEADITLSADAESESKA